MYILNKITKTVQECINADAIAFCKRDQKHYVVADTMEALKEKEIKKGPEELIEEPEHGEDTTPQGSFNEPEDIGLDTLEKKTVEELRNIAKEIGIRGYKNMNKSTLVALIIDAKE